MPIDFSYRQFDCSKATLRNLWEAFYVAQGVPRFRAAKLARVKADQGRYPITTIGGDHG